MTQDTAQAPIELVTVSEAARRIGVCGNTLRRRLERDNVTPDAYLLEGTRNNLSPLFVSPRLTAFKKLMQKQ
jgi:hypothetical protein